jgi:hypothetical protein
VSKDGGESPEPGPYFEKAALMRALAHKAKSPEAQSEFALLAALYEALQEDLPDEVTGTHTGGSTPAG